MRRFAEKLKNMTSVHYEAAMVLGGSGDAIGYRNGRWELCRDGLLVHAELKSLGGLSSLVIKPPDWIVSDDTVMHLATAEALAEYSDSSSASNRETLYTALAENYIKCMSDMDSRGPGRTCIASTDELRKNRKQETAAAFWHLPFNSKGAGCGAAMRSACIGLRYPSPTQLNDLIAVSVESGRMTHHHPVGYLGGLVAALFTAYAIQGRPLRDWGAALVDEVLPAAQDYIKSQCRYVAENLAEWAPFETAWRNYLTLRHLGRGGDGPIFPKKYEIQERDAFYSSISLRGIGGATGHDSVIIAYDALLGSNEDWLNLCERAMLHGGDNDSTGCIAGSWFGALYGYQTVPPTHHECLEYRDRMLLCARKLYQLASCDLE